MRFEQQQTQSAGELSEAELTNSSIHTMVFHTSQRVQGTKLCLVELNKAIAELRAAELDLRSMPATWNFQQQRLARQSDRDSAIRRIAQCSASAAHRLAEATVGLEYANAWLDAHPDTRTGYGAPLLALKESLEELSPLELPVRDNIVRMHRFYDILNLVEATYARVHKFNVYVPPVVVEPPTPSPDGSPADEPSSTGSSAPAPRTPSHVPPPPPPFPPPRPTVNPDDAGEEDDGEEDFATYSDEYIPPEMD